MSLKYEPASEPLHVSGWGVLRESIRARQRVSPRPELIARFGVATTSEERNFIELLKSDRELEESREGSK